MVSVDCLIDYKLSSPSAMTQKGNNQQQQLSKKGEFKPPKKNGGRPKKKKLESFQARVGEKVNSSQTTRPVGYLICDGLHRVRDCPKKEKINALIATDEDNSELETPTRVNPL